MDVDQDGDGGVHGGNGFNGEDGVEEASAGAPLLLRNLDAHQAHGEKLLHQARRKLLLVVHLADQRSDGLLGELADRGVEKSLFFRELGESGRGMAGFGQGNPASGFGVYQRWRWG